MIGDAGVDQAGRRALHKAGGGRLDPHRLWRTCASLFMLEHIWLSERRLEGDHQEAIPCILRGSAPYDPDVDRFLLELPLNGRRSRHSVRASGYDLVVWIRFLEQARGTTAWKATHDDVLAFHNARRQCDAARRIAENSWNRSITTLDKLYNWGVERGRIARSPFRYREVRRFGSIGTHTALTKRNMAMEPAPRTSNVRHLSIQSYRQFVDVGLRGRHPGGHARDRARDRNGERNALFADFLVSTGLRLEEASSLLACEMPLPSSNIDNPRQIPFAVPPLVTKGNRGRTILIPRRLTDRLCNYLEIERFRAIEKFVDRETWRRLKNPIFAEKLAYRSRTVRLTDGTSVSLNRFNPGERQRLVFVCNGVPLEPAALWLSEIGLPVQPNTWEATFLRASRRCAANKLEIYASPHSLRHTFAVHMLAMLIEHHARPMLSNAGSMDVYRQILSDPLQRLQRLLGHSSILSTYIYLEEVASEADTIDTAVEHLLATLVQDDSR